jgi:hypothetical protein
MISAVGPLALLTVMPSPAGAQAGAVYGGSGGRYFEYACGPGQVLVGLRGSAGVLLDSIQAVCARVDGNATVEASAQGPVVGNDRPFDKAIDCPAGTAVTAAIMARNESYPHLGAIRLFCTELAQREAGGTTPIDISGSGHFEGYDSPYFLLSSHEGGMPGSSQCPGGYAVGIRGRDDGYVTAFGLLCGPKPSAMAGDPNAGHTLGKRKRPDRPVFAPGALGDSVTTSSIPGAGSSPAGTLDQQRGSGSTFESPAAAAPRTLGKRKRPAQPGPQPAQTDQPISAINSDTGIGSGTPAEPPSPLINGAYATTVSVTDSRCLGQDLTGTWRGMAELNPQPAISIPLQTMGPLFAAPLTLDVHGLVIRQSTQLQMRSGFFGGGVPADLDGAFSNDGGQFNVRFTAGNALCRIGGTIAGVRG